MYAAFFPSLSESVDHIYPKENAPGGLTLPGAWFSGGELFLALLLTDNCCYCSSAIVTGGRSVAGIGVNDHHLGHVTADNRARFRYHA